MEGCFTFTPTTSRIAFKWEFRHISHFSPTLTVELFQVAELLPGKMRWKRRGEREREGSNQEESDDVDYYYNS
jgi:hypothetical protein